MFWGDNHRDNLSLPLPADGSGEQTNERAVIMAAEMALAQAANRAHRKVVVMTDSQFLIDSVTKWMPKWCANGWLTDSGEMVPNRADFERLARAMGRLTLVSWKKVEGGADCYGNQQALRLAREAAAKAKTPRSS